MSGRSPREPESIAPSRFIFGDDAARAAEREFSSDRDFLHKKFGICLPAPNLNDKENGFWIGEAEYADIADAISDLNPEGAEICECLRKYVLLSPSSSQ